MLNKYALVYKVSICLNYRALEPINLKMGISFA